MAPEFSIVYLVLLLVNNIIFVESSDSSVFFPNKVGSRGKIGKIMQKFNKVQASCTSMGVLNKETFSSLVRIHRHSSYFGPLIIKRATDMCSSNADDVPTSSVSSTKSANRRNEGF